MFHRLQIADLLCIKILGEVSFRGECRFNAVMKSARQDHATWGQRSFDYESQTTCSLAYTIVSTLPQFERLYKFKVREDRVRLFVHEMVEFENVEMGFYYDDKSMQCDNWLAFNYNAETVCHICKKPFNTDDTEKVRDHDLVTGQYRAQRTKAATSAFEAAPKSRFLRQFQRLRLSFHRNGYEGLPRGAHQFHRARDGEISYPLPRQVPYLQG